MANQIHGRELLKVDVQGQTRNLVVLRGKGSTRLFDAHPLVERFNEENRTNLRVVQSNVADVALNVGTPYKLPSFPVDAIVAYERSGAELGSEIVFAAHDEIKVVLATGKYKGERDVALVALGLTSADFVKDGNSFILAIQDSRLIVVPNFPQWDGWYMPHPETKIPHGRKVEPSADARYLLSSAFPHVGILVRSGMTSSGIQLIDTDSHPRMIHGVVAEVPDVDVSKIKALINSGQPGAKTVI